jgi:hypothetical protein
MMIKVIAVARLREKYWQDAVADYIRRLQPYARLEIVEIPEARIPAAPSTADQAKAMDQEGRAILERLEKHNGPVVVLDAWEKPSIPWNWLPGWRGSPCKAGKHSMGDRRPSQPISCSLGKSRSRAIFFQNDLSASDDETYSS